MYLSARGEVLEELEMARPDRLLHDCYANDEQRLKRC